MNNKWIYDKVHLLIKKYKTNNPRELIKAMNIKLIPIENSNSLLGMYNVIQRNRFIFLAENVGKLEKTILAHEIGHDQLHRKICIKGKAFHENRIFNESSLYELQANIFAAHLLISDEDIINTLKKEKTDKEMAGELGVDINLLNLKISEMAKLRLLPFDNIRTERPKSDFLKNYVCEDSNCYDSI